MRKRLFALLLLLTLVVTALAGCGPEAGRARGGHSGADIGNRPAEVRPPSKLYSLTEPAASIYRGDFDDEQ